MSLISNLRVGVSLNMIEGIPLDLISGLIGDAQPATIMAASGKEMEPAERDAARAALVRARLA